MVKYQLPGPLESLLKSHLAAFKAKKVYLVLRSHNHGTLRQLRNICNRTGSRSPMAALLGLVSAAH